MRRVTRIHYRKNKHQKEFDEDDTTKFLHLSSGFGGGKSHGLIKKLFKLSRQNRGMPGGCVVPTLPDFKKDLLPLFEEILDHDKVRYRYHKTDKWFTFPWSDAKLYIVSAENKIRGANWAYAGLNEVTLIPHVRYKETIGRVRIKDAPNPQVVSSGTPEGTSHWLYEIFIEKPMKNSRIIYGDTRDNLINLNEDYVDTLESSYDEIMLDAYLRGLFVNMKGNRFYYAYDPKINDDDTIEQIEDAEVFVSLDYNVDPMVATLWNIVTIRNERGKPLCFPDGQPIRRAQAFDQIEISGPKGADTKHMVAAFYERGLDPETTTIFPDPAGKARSTSGPPDNEQLKSGGFKKVKARLAAPRFRRRQLAVCNLLSKGLIRLNPKTCKALKRDLEAVQQDPATYEKIKDNPKLTHASDGMDYFIEYEFPLSGSKPDSRSVKFR